MVLFLGVGPRRARVYAHMTGAGLGGAFVLGAQVYAVLPPATIDAIAAWFERAGLMPSAQAQTWLTWPIDAVRGDVTAMALLLALGTLVFAATITLLGERFARAAMVARSAPTPGSATRDPRPIRFRTGAGRNLRAKEWRLLARDPSLFAQLGLQIIYTIPVAVILLRSDVVPMAFAIVPTIVVIAAQVAGSIAWITVSGEDAPELIATAPVTMPAVERAKLSAVAMPVLIILALPLIGLALADLYLAIMAFAFAALAGTSTALLNFWHPMPGNRRGMLRRHSQSKLIGLVEHGLAMLWAVAAVFAVAGHWAVLVPLAMVAGILAFAVKRRLPKPTLPMVAPAAVEA